MFLTNEIISPDYHADTLKNEAAGAFVTFEGWVRNHHEHKEVISLEYEAYIALAEKEIERILNEAKNEFAILSCKAIHRLGLLKPGDLAVWLGVTAVHRQDAYIASHFIIDAIKNRVPIWKKETYKNGSANWVNCTTVNNCSKAPTEPPHKDNERNPVIQQHDNLPGKNLSLDTKDSFDKNNSFSKQFFARQKQLAEIGEAGQQKLSKSHILVVGAGGLGCPALVCLAGAGIGKISILDGDSVSISNLHRQFLYGRSDLDKPKATIAMTKLAEQFPLTKFFAIDNNLEEANASSIMENCTLILDCTDSLPAKLLCAKTAFAFNKPLIQASLHKFSAILSGYFPKHSETCPRCVWAENPDTFVLPTCEEAGILGATTNIIGSLQAQEAIKYISTDKSFLFKQSLLLDLLSFHQIKIQNRKSKNCPVCRQKTEEALAAEKQLN